MSTISSLEMTPTSETTDEKDTLQKDKIIYTTLQGEIEKRLKELDNQNTFVQNAPFRESNNELFEIAGMAKNFKFLDEQKYFSKTQKWIGHILEIQGDTIIAKLNDLNNPTTHEIAEFEMSEIPYEDRNLVSIGAGFYWSLGYANDNGQIEKKSLIRFQRTKPWEESDLNRVVANVNKLYDKLNNWDIK